MTDLFAIEPEPLLRGPLVVLIHGSMDRSTSFGRKVRQLPDVPVLRYDRRGYGRSIDAGVADLDGHVDDLLDLLAGRPAVAVGHSYGALVALVAARRRPDTVLAVGAFEPPMPWADWWPRDSAGSVVLTPGLDDQPAEAAAEFMRRMVGEHVWRRLPARTRAERRAEGPALVTELRSLRRSGAPLDLTELTVPVLAGMGSETAERHRRAAEVVATTVPGARLEVVAGAGHGAHLSHPREFAAFVRRAAEPVEGTLPGR